MKNYNHRIEILEVRRETGLGFVGFSVGLSMFLVILFLALNIYPIISEKSKVDMALESLRSNPAAALMSIPNIATSIEKQLSINYVTSLTKKDILKALTVKNTKDGKRVAFQYEISKDFSEKWRMIYKYDNMVIISSRSN